MPRLCKGNDSVTDPHSSASSRPIPIAKLTSRSYHMASRPRSLFISVVRQTPMARARDGQRRPKCPSATKLDGMQAGIDSRQTFVVGGRGYVGSQVVVASTTSVQIVSRTGSRPTEIPSTAWSEWLNWLSRQQAAAAIWLLDGAKHDELNRLNELINVARDLHVVLVSTCTVYGNKGDELCSEDAELELLTPHAKVKRACERMLEDSGLPWSVARLGALYGWDDRRVRADRTEKWVEEAAAQGKVTVPDPDHWRGWVHRDQAARALWRMARDRHLGVFNIASSNMTFAEAVQPAADAFGARVEHADAPDLCSYQVDSTRAYELGILDEQPGESVEAETLRQIARWRDAHPS